MDWRLATARLRRLLPAKAPRGFRRYASPRFGAPTRLSGQARRRRLGFTALMAFFPAVLIAQVLPISIGGLGVREFALVFFLGAVGVGKEQALALGLLFYILTLVASLTGAPAFAVGGRFPEPEDVLA